MFVLVCVFPADLQYSNMHYIFLYKFYYISDNCVSHLDEHNVGKIDFTKIDLFSMYLSKLNNNSTEESRK